MGYFEAISLFSLLKWFLVWNAIGAASMTFDKHVAERGFERISERTLFGISLLGGFVGVIASGRCLRHKTSKGRFWVPVVLSMILWMAFLYLRFS